MKSLIKNTLLNTILLLYITASIVHAIYRAYIIRKPVDIFIFFNWNLGYIEYSLDKIIGRKENKEKPEKRKKESHFPLRKWQKSKGEMNEALYHPCFF